MSKKEEIIEKYIQLQTEATDLILGNIEVFREGFYHKIGDYSGTLVDKHNHWAHEDSLSAENDGTDLRVSYKKGDINSTINLYEVENFLNKN